MPMSLPKPELDVAARWNSTYTMLDTLDEIKSLVRTLEPVYLATLKLQSTQLYMGDFYQLWLELKLAVSATTYLHSRKLHQCIQNREKALLENHVVVCRIYLDPRIRRVLLQTPLTLMLARVHLKQLMLRIHNMDQNIDHVPIPCIVNSQASTSSQAENREFLRVSNTCSLSNEFLNSIEVASDDEEAVETIEKNLQKAYFEIDNFNPIPIDVYSNIMEYWEKAKFRYPNLYQLAKIVHSVPAMQVSVERAFSALRLVLSDLRCNLSSESLQKLLFVKLNMK